MKMLSIQLFVTYFFLIHSTNGQCPLNCFCLDSSVTCTGLKSIPPIFPEDTRYLTISGIEVEQIPAGVFNRLPLLESIEIFDGNVGKISSDAFQSLSTLEFITLSELSIGTIESYAFNKIIDTGSVSLVTSTIGLIQPYAFFDMFALDYIKVSSNKVEYIDSFAFSTIDELLEFSFQSNQVKTMKPYAFSQFSNLYEFSMYLNTIGDIGCGNFETMLHQTEEQSFYSNKFNCTCNIAWVSNNPSLRKFLFSNICQLPGTEEKIKWENVSIETLHCSDSNTYECPSEEYLEMLIPNERMTALTTETSTRPFSSTSSPQTPSSSEMSQEDLSREPIYTPIFETFSTFERTTKTRTIKTSTATTTVTTTPTKTSSTKVPLPPTTTRDVDVNIDNTKSSSLPTNPKIVIANKTTEVNSEDKTKQKRGSDELVFQVNGIKVNSLCWFWIVTALTLTVI